MHGLSTVCLQLKDEITMKVQEVDREARKKAKLEKDLVALRKELEAQNVELKSKQTHAQKLEEECQKLEHDLKSSKVGRSRGGNGDECMYVQCALFMRLCIT